MAAPDENANQNEQKAPTPQRLQGLSGRGGRGSLRGGRFLPNAVGRRSKEERESTAPALKPQPPSPKQEGPPKKFERRKQRQLGTRAEAAGPLAAPTIAATAPRARASGGIATTTGSSGSRGGIRVKAETDNPLTTSLATDVRIDMSIIGDREDYIPLRMPTEQRSVDQLEGKSEEPSAVVEKPGAAEERLEHEQLSRDDLHIENGSLYLLQLPELGITAGKAPSTSPLVIKNEDVKIEESTEPIVNGAQSGKGPENTDVIMDEDLTDMPMTAPAGRIGTLRHHQSGKLSMVLGDVVYEVVQGTHGSSLEQMMILNESNNHAYSLGSIASRLLVIPDLDSLHI